VAIDVPTEISGTPLEHLPYSPDLTPCNFWAFPTMKRVKTACPTILQKLVANGLQHVSEKWVEHSKKCITCQRRYFEKETVTAPPQSSESE
jgi:hypothetical protein